MKLSNGNITDMNDTWYVRSLKSSEDREKYTIYLHTVVETP